MDKAEEGAIELKDMQSASFNSKDDNESVYNSAKSQDTNDENQTNQPFFPRYQSTLKEQIAEGTEMRTISPREEEISVYNSTRSQDTNYQETRSTTGAVNDESRADEPLLGFERIEKSVTFSDLPNEGAGTGMVPSSSTFTEANSLLVQETNLDEITEESHVNDIDQIADSNRKTRIERIREYLADNNHYARLFKPTKAKLICALIILGILFVVAFLPSCIFSLELEKYALVRNTLTGSLYDKHVYESGLHFLMPWNEWVEFDRTAHSMQINDLTIFTTDKLQVNASFVIFYFLDKDRLGQFYRNFGDNYKRLVLSVARSELMNTGQRFSIDDYRTRRVEVKNLLREKLSSRLKDDYMINLFDLYLNKLKFTSQINKLNLLRVLNGIFNEKEQYHKESNMTVQETNYQINRIRNNALEELETANIKANLTISKIAKTDFDLRQEFAHIESLNNSLVGLDFYNPLIKPKDKPQRILSFCYLTALINMDNLNVYARDGVGNSTVQAKSEFNHFIGLINY